MIWLSAETSICLILCATAVRGELAALVSGVFNWLSVRVLRCAFFISQWTSLTHFACLLLRLLLFWFLLVIWSGLRWSLLLLSDLTSSLIEYFDVLSYIKNAIYATLRWSLGVDHPITATVLSARVDIAAFNQSYRWIWRHELLFRGKWSVVRQHRLFDGFDLQVETIWVSSEVLTASKFRQRSCCRPVVIDI